MYYIRQFAALLWLTDEKHRKLRPWTHGWTNRQTDINSSGYRKKFVSINTDRPLEEGPAEDRHDGRRLSPKTSWQCIDKTQPASLLSVDL